MNDATAGAHAGAGHDHAWTRDIVKSARISGLRTWFGYRKAFHQLTRRDHFLCFFVKQLRALAINFGRFNRHGTVEEDGKLGQSASTKSPGQKEKQKLSTPDSKHRHENLRFILDCAGDYLSAFDRRFMQRTMITITVGRFHDYGIRLLKRNRIIKQRRAPRAEVTGKDHDLFASIFRDGQLDAG